MYDSPDDGCLVQIAIVILMAFSILGMVVSILWIVEHVRII